MEEDQSRPFAIAIDDLQNFIAGQQRKEDELRRQLFLLQEETRKAKRALEILTDRKANQTRQEQHKKARTRWVPRQPKIDAVMAAITLEPQTVPQIAALSGVSHETARKALDHLREQERVRMTGIVRAGKSNQKAHAYALMPSEGTNGTTH